MTWTLGSADRAQSCGRHMNTVAAVFSRSPRDAYTIDLEAENMRLRQRVRALTEAITSLSDYIDQKEGK